MLPSTYLAVLLANEDRHVLQGALLVKGLRRGERKRDALARLGHVLFVQLLHMHYPVDGSVLALENPKKRKLSSASGLSNI